MLKSLDSKYDKISQIGLGILYSALMLEGQRRIYIKLTMIIANHDNNDNTIITLMKAIENLSKEIR